MIAVNGCKHCGVEKRDHGQLWTPTTSWHYYVEPSDLLRLLRLKARRAAAEGSGTPEVDHG